MKTKTITLLLFVCFFTYNIKSQEDIDTYKENKENLIERYVDSINFKLKLNNKVLILDYLIVSIETKRTFVDEYGNETNEYLQKKIYDKKDLKDIDNDYKFIGLNFKNKYNKNYHVLYEFNHNNKIKSVQYEIKNDKVFIKTY